MYKYIPITFRKMTIVYYYIIVTIYHHYNKEKLNKLQSYGTWNSVSKSWVCTCAIKAVVDVHYTNITKLQSVLHINPINNNMFNNMQSTDMNWKYVNNDLDSNSTKLII